MIVANGPGLAELVDTEGGIERIAEGLIFTEGPLWLAPGEEARIIGGEETTEDPNVAGGRPGAPPLPPPGDPVGLTNGPRGNGCLLFSDIIGDTIYRWTEDEGAAPWRRPSSMANGLALDREGRLLACEHATSRLTRTERDGAVTVVASHYGGKELNSPNDVVVRSDGAVLFTDPPAGRTERYGVERAPELGFQGVFLVPPAGGEPVLLADDYELPNGLCFSPDERLLYVNDTRRMELRVYEMRGDRLGEGGTFARMVARPELGEGAPDGMKTDERGNVYVTGPGGIWVYAPDGGHLGVLLVPRRASNLAWGGADGRELYITAADHVYRVRMRVGRAGGVRTAAGSGESA